MLATVAGNTLGNLLLLFCIPFLVSAGYQIARHRLPFDEIRDRAGLRLGQPRYLLYCLVASGAVVLLLLAWPPSPDTFGREARLSDLSSAPA